MKNRLCYDRFAVGNRLRSRRLQMGWSRRVVAEKIGKVEKYYADIERGCCGMSIETLIVLAQLYGFGLDELIYGDGEEGKKIEKDKILIKLFQDLPSEAQDSALQLLHLYMKGIYSSKSIEK